MIMDTYKAVQKLVNIGIKKEHAVAFTEIINEQNSDLATKSDLALVKSELKSDIAELRSELKSDIVELRSELKSDISNLRNDLKADISDINNDLKLIKKDFLWIKALLVGVMGLLVKIAFF
jgi:hypothetical protein